MAAERTSSSVTDLAPPTLDSFVARWRPVVERALDGAIGHGEPLVLYEAMRYAALGPGKRIRPMLVLASCYAVGGDPKGALAGAVAVEMIHAFSLVHDDLPCMDDDDFRRGRATCHKVFGKANALLAGDALLAAGLGHLACQSGPWVRNAVAELALAVADGMIPGQVLDMLAEGANGDVDLETLHGLKTGRLIAAACSIGALAAGASEQMCNRLIEYGRRIGLAFQIADDVLDAAPGSGGDVDRHKATYPERFGLAEARRMAEAEVQVAIGCLSEFGVAAEPLRAIARFTVERDS